jgi:U4/U6 small nuclear ribonucleoprotein PRP31
MHKVAPNLCRLVGSSVASKLISCAGGIDRLAAMPACNIQVLGSEKTPTLGFGMVGRNHMGFFGPMDIVRKAPNKWQVQLVRMLSTNVAKCARVDALRTCPSGN